MSTNPLKQYFRRPAAYIKLPSGGKYYSKDEIDLPPDGELPVFPMSAIDEITSRTPDALYNGHAVVEIIKSCIPAIKNPWKITTVDMDSILIGIRIASTGENMDINCVCPKCNTEGAFGLNLINLLSSRRDVDYGKTLKTRDLEIKFRPLRYEETNRNNMAQYDIQKVLTDLTLIEDEEERNKKGQEALKYINNLTTDIVATTIEWIKTPETTVGNTDFIKEFINNCDRQTAAAIKQFSVDLREQSILPPLPAKCTNCENEFEQPLMLNVSDFFV